MPSPLTWWHVWSYIVSSASWMDGPGGWCGSDVWQVMFFHDCFTLAICLSAVCHDVKWSMIFVGLFSGKVWGNFLLWYFGWTSAWFVFDVGEVFNFMCHVVCSRATQHKGMLLEFWPALLTLFNCGINVWIWYMLWQWTHPVSKLQVAHDLLPKHEFLNAAQC